MQLHGGLFQQSESDEEQEEQRDTVEDRCGFTAVFLHTQDDRTERGEDAQRCSDVQRFHEVVIHA